MFQCQLAGVDFVGFAQLLDTRVHKIRNRIIYCAHGWAQVQPHLHQLHQQNLLHILTMITSGLPQTPMQGFTICYHAGAASVQESRPLRIIKVPYLTFTFLQRVFDSTLIPWPQEELSNIQGLHGFLNLHTHTISCLRALTLSCLKKGK